jgi:hypothetical protein
MRTELTPRERVGWDRTASAGAPSPGLSPKKTWGRGDALRQGATRGAAGVKPLRNPTSPKVFGGSGARFTSPEGPGEGPPAGAAGPLSSSRDPSESSTSPRGFWGRWARFTSPEGARPSRRILRSTLFSLACAALVSPAAAQTPRPAPADSVEVAGVRVEPDTVTVGERFRAAVFVRAPAGARVALVVPPARDGSYQTVDSVRVYPPDSAGLTRAVATMVMWVTDPAGSARAETRVTLPGAGVRTTSIQLPLPSVRAVLPADSTQPRPPKDIIPNPRQTWPWAWVAAAAVAVLAVLVLWWMRRRRRPRAAISVDPRKHALAELDRLRASGMIEPDGVEAFSAEVGRILREFAAAVDARLGTDLTSEELIDHLRRTGVREEDVGSVAGALAHADLAKFARARPTPERALEDWEAARRWVQTFRADAAVPEPAGSG